MTSLILRTTALFLVPLLFLFSLFLLLRGHNAPGGGFVGGLVSASAFALYAIAEDVHAARRILRMDPRRLIAIGLLVAAASGLSAWLAGRTFLSGIWLQAGRGGFAVGTPLVFDTGVYLVVLGATMTILFSLAEE